MSNRIDGGLHVSGNFSATSVTLPAGTVTDVMVNAGAAIGQEKLEHQHRANFSQPNTTATAETKVVHVAYADGELLDFRAGLIGPCVGAATVTFDLKKNGTTVLTGVVTLNNTHSARQDVAGTISGTVTCVTGDVFEVVTTATAGGGTIGTGAFASMTIKEAAQ